ncbi:MAG: hypothetical protein JSS81_20560 [Acidobacteria bacterium]|nr:hypothetical protein [Acidobacteriota bacterium]
MVLKCKSLKLICFLSLISVNISCQQTVYNFQTNSERASIVKSENENVQSNIKVGDDSNELVNTDGWKLPSVSSFTKKSEKSIEVKIDDSQIKVNRAEYLPDKDVIQVADGNTFNDAPRVSGIEDKSWLIRDLKIFSVKDKPFCYLMRGNWVKTDQNGKIEARLSMSIVLVYFDKDGDGIFETFKYSSSEFPPIPEWIQSYR